MCSQFGLFKRLPLHTSRKIKGQVDCKTILPYLINRTSSKTCWDANRSTLNSQRQRMPTCSLNGSYVRDAVLIVLVGDVQYRLLTSKCWKSRKEIPAKIDAVLRICAIALCKKDFQLRFTTRTYTHLVRARLRSWKRCILLNKNAIHIMQTI